MKRVLIISPHFPPVNAPDCHRVRMSLPYYRRFGWDPVVLAVHPRHRPDWRDESLSASLPDDVPVHYCEALPLGFTRWFGIHNLGLRCVPFISRTGVALLLREQFDLVFFSTTQYLVTPLGPVWLRDTGVPYVIDLQDPWRSDYYEQPGAPRPPGGWKYQFARLTAWLFEERAFRGAAGFISVSHHYFRELAQRYPWFAARPQAVIPFGGPQADFDHLRAHPAPSPVRLGPAGCQHWVAAGSLGPAFGHALRVLFAGLKRLRVQDPALAARLRLHFVGTSYAPPDQAPLAAKPIAEAYGVGDLVTESPPRIGYLDSLRLMQDADGLLLLGSDDLAYSPSKIYPNYMTGRPILALAHHGSLLADLLTRLNCAQLVTLLKPGEEMQPAHAVAKILGAAAQGHAAAGQPARDEPWFRQHLLAEAGARRQCEFFDQVLGPREGGG
ncbi:MAG: hypothetical protein PSU94_02660 [Lacunisphaera sp.]|nr:hypothetical protein [Lacunisphaera sp.]